MATAAMDSPNLYTESAMDQEDVVYPCKGCGEILEEGKAFELAGNRWHIDCFRCNTCGTLLDSDANLLLLGDGSLICNNCTYSCSACGNKIEDLAILTGDQAFCSGCFRCRNCKRKIENLRYARTSQGIFCMGCHESLMARRRKKARGTPKASSSGHAEKALPSLPPGVAPTSAFTPDVDTPPDTHSESHTPQPRSPKDTHMALRNGATTMNYKRDVSPLSDEIRQDGPTLPASTYSDGKPGNISSDEDDGQERGFLPMAFDPTPIAAPPAGPTHRKQLSRPTDFSPPVVKENYPPRDYFNGNARLSVKAPPRDRRREEPNSDSLRSLSTEREIERLEGPSKASPHILFQEKGRTTRKPGTSGASSPLAGSIASSPVVATLQERSQQRPKPQHLTTDSYTPTQQEGFKLQEVPKTKRRSSKASGSPALVSPIEPVVPEEVARPVSPISVDSQSSGVNPFDDPTRKEIPQSTSAPLPPKHGDRSLPLRGDSLGASAHKSQAPGRESPAPAVPSGLSHAQSVGHARHASASSVPSSFADAQSSLSPHDNPLRPANSPKNRISFDAIPPRSASRPSHPSKPVAKDEFVAPRAPPPPPPTTTGAHRNHGSISTMQSDRSGQPSPAMGSAGLPKYNGDGTFTMEDEMGRILRDNKRDKAADSASPSVMRRVSNAVKHGRNQGDRESTSKPAKSPARGSVTMASPPLGVASPNISSPATSEGTEQVRASLRRAQQHIAELEADKIVLQEKLGGSSDIQAMDVKLDEKRSTIAELDRSREMVMRELTTMADNLAQNKRQPQDLPSLKSNILNDFADSLQKLKDSLSAQVEDLMHKRNELTDEIGNLIQMKDKGFQEYESLSTKNAQLAQHNNELVRSIQGMYQDARTPGQASGGANGLGIYNGGSRVETPGTERNISYMSSDPSMSNLLHESDAQPARIMEGPRMVNIPKGVKPNKFNWRKGGEKMAKNVQKGIKAIAGGDRPGGRDDMPYSIGLPYNQTHQSVGGSDQYSTNSRSTADGKGFGFFGPKAGGARTGNGLGHPKDDMANSVVAADGSTLFGSELSLRCEYEGRLVPSIITRCVAEIELRGMELEGVYRKSGGAGQVKAIQQGFEKDGDFDLSDPELDVHAITSALKQYFRKLPTPLIPNDVYDALLEAGQIQHDREKQAAALRSALSELPNAHRDVLEFLLQHLARVMSHSTQSLMNAFNLSTVFAPTIMRPLTIEQEMNDVNTQRAAAQALLEHNRALFVYEE